MRPTILHRVDLDGAPCPDLSGAPTAVRSPIMAPGIDSREPERSDAARNRALLLDAATRLVAEQGAGAVTMDDVARAAGVGKGTVFRRFGSRAGLMRALLDHSEARLQGDFLRGPPPLGPGADPRDRLIAYGRARLAMVAAHRDILIEADAAAGLLRMAHPARQASMLHIRSLLSGMGFARPTPTLCEAVAAPLEPMVVDHLMTREHLTVDELAGQYGEFVRSLIP